MPEPKQRVRKGRASATQRHRDVGGVARAQELELGRVGGCRWGRATRALRQDEDALGETLGALDGDTL